MRRVGPLSDTERYRFDLHGYIVREGVLSPAEVAALGDAFDTSSDAPAPLGDGDGSQLFQDLLRGNPAVRALLDHPGVLDPLRELLGDGLRLDHARRSRSQRGTDDVAFRGGGTPFDPARSYAHRDGRMHSGLTTVLWALTDLPAGSGGFRCIPGSHTSSFPLPPGVAEEVACEVPLQPGSALIFTEALTHGLAPWVAPHERHVLLLSYCPGSSAWERADEWSHLLDESGDSFGEHARRLLRPPYAEGRRDV